VKERTFAGAAGAHDGQELAALYLEIHAIERLHGAVALLIFLFDVFDNQWSHEIPIQIEENDKARRHEEITAKKYKNLF
jgi:hypothetical protein